MSYIKLDTRILTSTLWVDKDARDVFITALLMAEPWEFTEPMEQLQVRSLDKTGFVVPPRWYGFVRSAGIGIIRQALLEPDEGYKALEALGSEDPESRSRAFGGRRLVRVNGGYVVLNFMDHRDYDHTAKERMQRLRQRKKDSTVTSNEENVTRNSIRTLRIADADANANAESKAELLAAAAPRSVTNTAPASSAGPGTATASSAAAASSPQPPSGVASEFKNSFGFSAKAKELVALTEELFGAEQCLDLNSTEVSRLKDIEWGDSIAALRFAASDSYWQHQMQIVEVAEGESKQPGADAFKCFVRAYKKALLPQCKKTKKRKVIPETASATGKKMTTQVKLKAASVAPKPEDLILGGEAL